MAPIIHGAVSSNIDFSNEDFGYTYPEELDLHPSSETHAKLVSMLKRRSRDSRNAIQPRFSSWRQMDNLLTAYTVLDDDEELEKNEDYRKPVRIVVPMSYATIDTLLTYWVAAFLDDPIFRFDGRGPEDVLGAILLEKHVEWQTLRKKFGLVLYTAWRDSFVYGFGATAVDWTKEISQRQSRQSPSRVQQLLNTALGKSSEGIEEVIYEGNELHAIDPYMYLPDPNYPIHEVQKGEHTGWVDRSNWFNQKQLEIAMPETWFNTDYLSDRKATSSLFIEENTGREDRADSIKSKSSPTNEFKELDRIHMYVKLIPDTYGLSSNTNPEKWIFTLGGDEVILRATRIILDHNMFPVSVCAPEMDGHSIAPISKLEIQYGLQQTIDWLYTSHIANVRKAINDMLIVDPSLINYPDLLEPGPGMLIRMRRAAWGRGVENAVKQLAVTDVTKGHLPEATGLMDMANRSSGAGDIAQGIVRSGGERRTATEYRATERGALSRLQKGARITSIQYMQDIAFMLASHTRQFSTEEQWFKVTGRWQEDLEQIYGESVKQGRILATPDMMDVLYDVVPLDGTLPGSQDAQAWTQLFQIISQTPEIAQAFDIVRIFKHIARNLGAKNMNDFVRQGGSIQPQVLPDQQVQQQATNGQLQPIPL